MQAGPAAPTGPIKLRREEKRSTWAIPNARIIWYRKNLDSLQKRRTVEEYCRSILTHSPSSSPSLFIHLVEALDLTAVWSKHSIQATDNQRLVRSMTFVRSAALDASCWHSSLSILFAAATAKAFSQNLHLSRPKTGP